MRRLPFTRELPDFCRTQWASAQARNVWQPRLQASSRAWMEIERLSVLEGLRPSALMDCGPQELPDAIHWAARRGLHVIPVSRSGTSGSYAASTRELKQGQPWTYRVALTRPENVTAWLDAWKEGDDDQMGRLLGYPECCRAFFRRTWVDEAMVDTTWAMAGAGEGKAAVRLEAAPENNILLRWLGIRAVSHLPCSFDCDRTRELGEGLLELGEEAGFEEEVGWIREALSWPVEWTALHGIAEIRTPVVKVIARTDATAGKLSVQLVGSTYPEDGATGTAFPYRENPGPKLTESRSFQQLVQLEDAREWTDNGFRSRQAMEDAHAVILEAVDALGIECCVNVIDLGCGNGELLRRVRERIRGAKLWGVEIDPGRAARARKRVEWIKVDVGDFTELLDRWQNPYGVALLMPGRLIEAGPERAADVLAHLREVAENVVLYAYGDWLQRYGSLGRLVREAMGGKWELDGLVTGDGVAAGSARVLTPATSEVGP